MQPLYDAPRHLFGKVLFLNDVFFCAHDMVELLYQSDLHQSDMTCGLDYDNTDKGLGFYDTYGYVQVLRMFLYLPNDIDTPLFRRATARCRWVDRDRDGEIWEKRPLPGQTTVSESNERMKQGLPFQVSCCW